MGEWESAEFVVAGCCVHSVFIPGVFAEPRNTGAAKGVQEHARGLGLYCRLATSGRALFLSVREGGGGGVGVVETGARKPGRTEDRERGRPGRAMEIR